MGVMTKDGGELMTQCSVVYDNWLDFLGVQ